jgi:holin-like protein
LALLGDTLLKNLSLLFVPAGVGVMAHLGLLGEDLLPIAVALIGSTVATIAVTALLMSWSGTQQPECGGDESR